MYMVYILSYSSLTIKEVNNKVDLNNQNSIKDFNEDNVTKLKIFR